MFNMNLEVKPCHIFLTGEKRIGKSTLINKILDNTDLSWDGIRSICLEKEGKRYIYLTNAKTPVTDDSHLVAVCSALGPEEIHADVFEDLGLKLLEKAEGVDLFVIDEIGFFENEAPLYKSALLKLFERVDLHIIGTLRMDENADMFNAMKGHDNIKMFIIKESNRNNMAPVVNRLLHNIQKS